MVIHIGFYLYFSLYNKTLLYIIYYYFSSPYTNEYYPPLEDGVTPPDNLRKLEVEANEIFEKYLHLYYEGGNSNVYVWETSEGTAACVLFRKG